MELIAFVLGWIALGLLAAVLLPTTQDSRFAWMPTAVCFGPLWAFVAMEMRTAEAEKNDLMVTIGARDVHTLSTGNGS